MNTWTHEHLRHRGIKLFAKSHTISKWTLCPNLFLFILGRVISGIISKERNFPFTKLRFKTFLFLNIPNILLQLKTWKPSFPCISIITLNFSRAPKGPDKHGVKARVYQPVTTEPYNTKAGRACSSKPAAINSRLTLRSSLGTWRFSPLYGCLAASRPCWAAQVWAAGLHNSRGLRSEAGAGQSPPQPCPPGFAFPLQNFERAAPKTKSEPPLLLVIADN